MKIYNTTDDYLIELTNNFFEEVKKNSIEKIATINEHQMQVEGWLKTELAHYIRIHPHFKNLETEKKIDLTRKRKVDIYFEIPAYNEVWIELKFWIGLQKNEKYPLSTTYLPLKSNYIRSDLNKMLDNQSKNNYFFIFYSNPQMETNELEEDIKKGITKIETEDYKYKLNLLKLVQYEKLFSVILLKFIKS